MTEQTRRSTRLVRIRDLLIKRGAVSASQLSNELGYSRRTIQRDLLALETELNVPLVYERRQWRIMPGWSQLPGPVRLSLQEARAVYFATRLMLRTADERDPDGISALEKIAEALPASLGEHMRRTVEDYRGLPVNMEAIEVLRRLTEAWAGNRTTVITYRSAHSSEPRTLELDPYILDHTQGGAYVVGHSHEHGEVRMFKVDRISHVEITQAPFEPHGLTELYAKLRNSWGGTVFGEDQFAVVIDFSPAVSQRVRETYWHPSQTLEGRPDGGVRLCVSLPSLLEITPWVRGWGADAVVAGPPELRDAVRSSFIAAAANYR